jgi:hypothetical protein
MTEKTPSNYDLERWDALFLKLDALDAKVQAGIEGDEDVEWDGDDDKASDELCHAMNKIEKAYPSFDWERRYAQLASPKTRHLYGELETLQ